MTAGGVGHRLGAGRWRIAPARRSPIGGAAITMAAIALASCVVVGTATALAPAAGLAALAAVVLGLAVLDRPAIAAFVLVGAVPMLSGLRRGLPVPGLRLSEVLIVGLSVTVLVTAQRRQLVRWRTLDWLALAYALGTVLLGLIAVLARGERFTADLVGEMIGPLQFLLLYRATATALSSSRDCRVAVRFALLGAILVSAVTVVQMLDVPGVRPLLSSLTASDPLAPTNRATGLFPHWHELGAFMFLMVVLALALWLGGSERVLPRRVMLGVLTLAASALLLTATLAPILVAIAAGAALAVRYGRLGRVAVWGSVLALAGALIFGSLFQARLDQQYNPRAGAAQTGLVPFTLIYRYDVWVDQYIPAVAPRLVSGFGPGTPPEVTWQYTENGYITILLRGGVPLLLIFLALLWAFYARARAATAAVDPDLRALAWMVAMSTVVLVPLQMVVPVFVNVGAPHAFWALAGVLVAWSDADDRS